MSASCKGIRRINVPPSPPPFYRGGVGANTNKGRATQDSARRRSVALWHNELIRNIGKPQWFRSLRFESQREDSSPECDQRQVGRQQGRRRRQKQLPMVWATGNQPHGSCSRRAPASHKPNRCASGPRSTQIQLSQHDHDSPRRAENFTCPDIRTTTIWEARPLHLRPFELPGLHK